MQRLVRRWRGAVSRIGERNEMAGDTFVIIFITHPSLALCALAMPASWLFLQCFFTCSCLPALCSTLCLVCRAHSLLLFKYLLTCRSPDGPFLDIPCLPSPMSLYPALFFFIFAEYLLLTDIVYTRGLACFSPKDTLRKTAIFCCID